MPSQEGVYPEPLSAAGFNELWIFEESSLRTARSNQDCMCGSRITSRRNDSFTWFCSLRMTLIQGNKRPKMEKEKRCLVSRFTFVLRRRGISVPARTLLRVVSLLPAIPNGSFHWSLKTQSLLGAWLCCVSCPGVFETIPSGGSRGRCESSQRDMLGQETRPSFKQSQPPARVRGRGRCQGSGEPVQFISLVKFCGLILPGVITAHCVLGSAPCFPVLYLF